MKEKGFTLIELLAVIVILAIIVVITVPQILDIVEDSKKNAMKDSGYGYKNAVHQYYLTESTKNSEFGMNGIFFVENGVLTNGIEVFNISTEGSLPESGSVTVEDGEIVDGCINYGKYSVVIENGNVTDTIEDGCYNISYFTYDENASSGVNGKITDKLLSPNLSWTYYIKEYEVPNKYRYRIGLVGSDTISEQYSFLSMENCQRFINDNFGEGNSFVEQHESVKTYQFCSGHNNKSFCLKPGEINYDYNVSTLDEVFDDCYSSYQGVYTCDDIIVRNDDILFDNCKISIVNSEQHEFFYKAICDDSSIIK